MANIDIGAACEHRFAAELLERGVMTNWPSSQQHPYDMIADTGDSQWKIQVKGTRALGRSVDFKFRMRSGKGHRRKYTRKEIDFLVLYVFNYDAWYIFPVEEVGIGVTVKPGQPGCKYQKYLEAWHLIDPKLKG